MTQTHTPAPWYYDGEHIRAQTKDDGEVSVAIVRGWEDEFRDEEVANSRLIAASPELLEALEYARDRLIVNQGSSEPLIDAAINKAKGIV